MKIQFSFEPEIYNLKTMQIYLELGGFKNLDEN